jgi:hypothetical protein
MVSLVIYKSYNFINVSSGKPDRSGICNLEDVGDEFFLFEGA